ncbi:MAG: PAS domain-containing protein [Alphaproteobacteria bacterium]|nr:PAS domain-containing protein [Alphaproteobacteria bacterium]MBU1516658.1 PAS domain-containing protein [Alphaproteobacteria bacterium]MBU2094414.1 PAS domain-containing protein [Alphaproteobacteria bacterium]MBU2152641.1 PAS domain-containing protein [Alphaproteobacteria bacterium]MBU2307586.1 PAS domain-containing protein [Alphaproteobacteria bacterium]
MSPATFLRAAPHSAVAAQIAERDWTGTPLGPIDGWPTALRSTLALMLACPAPMYLAWGAALISFHNDAYTPVLGRRAPDALGKPFPELWADVWTDIAPMVDAALAGQATSVTDMKLDLSRDGEPEESYWSFSYSPVVGDDGDICGMLCVTGETTARVVAERERRAADERLEAALSAGDRVGAWDWDVVADRVVADHRFASLYGVDPDKAARGAPIAAFFSGMHPEDRPRVEAEIAAVLADGDTFLAEYRLMSETGAWRWVSAQGRAIRDAAGHCVRLPGVSIDITRRKTAELALSAAKDERDFVVELTATQRNLDSPEAVVRVSAEMLGRRLGVNRVGFYRLLGSDRMHHSVGWSDGVVPLLLGEQSVAAFGGYAERERAAGRSLVFSDSRFDAEGALGAYALDGVMAGICIPLLDSGRWAAGIYLHHASVRGWTAGEIALAKEVAGLTWLAVERAEAMVRLAQRVDRQAAALTEVTSELAVQDRSRRAAEAQLRQLQKMDALGKLTGGIAHDFNNMLAVIIGGLNLIERRLARGDTDIQKFLDGAIEGAERAAALTQRLLAFSRQQPLSPETLDVNQLISTLTDMLGRTLGETIRLETVLGAGLWTARADLSELENAIINLSVNARDAMPAGGRLTIETANAHIDDDLAREIETPSGQYVMVAVSDTGTGMSPEVLEKVFEPFFTTKPVGKGTGLGLSQVFGFVRQSGGHVRAYSEPGHGTTFKLYLPRATGDGIARAVPRPTVAVGRGAATEIVLVVEDEQRVRNYSVEALRELGYTVIHAASGPEALALLESAQDVTLLFTDVVMPDMTGRQLVDLALTLRPELKVLYTTGYTRNAIVHNGVLDPGTRFLAKPFTLEQLGAKVREALDDQSRAT